MFQEELEIGCKTFGLSVGIVSRIKNGQYRIKDAYGNTDAFNIDDVFPLEAVYCKHIYQNKKTLAFHDIREPSGKLLHPLYDAIQLQSYICAPIFLKNKVYGTLNFSSLKCRDTEFVESDIKLIEELALRVQKKLEMNE